MCCLRRRWAQALLRWHMDSAFGNQCRGRAGQVKGFDRGGGRVFRRGVSFCLRCGRFGGSLYRAVRFCRVGQHGCRCFAFCRGERGLCGYSGLRGRGYRFCCGVCGRLCRGGAVRRIGFRRLFVTGWCSRFFCGYGRRFFCVCGRGRSDFVVRCFYGCLCSLFLNCRGNGLFCPPCPVRVRQGVAPLRGVIQTRQLWRRVRLPPCPLRSCWSSPV